MTNSGKLTYGEPGWSNVAVASPVVNTRNGAVKGFTRNKNAVFFGIPYGDDCEGEYRFKAPRPAKKWDGIRDCTTYGNSAMQNFLKLEKMPFFIRPMLKRYFDHFTGGAFVDRDQEAMSENCLVLNVATPGTDEKKRTVMVYIHGGGFNSGSGLVTAITCDKLIDEENVVIVSVNHRLNLFGYLYLGGFDSKYSDSSLAGQLDLVLALKWVRDNIESFGGDPSNITLIGESGGGMKICTLMAMPEAEGLFHKAIIISGAAPVGIKTHEEGHRETLRVLRTLRIDEADWKKLLIMPAQKLLKGMINIEMTNDRLPFTPVADGMHLPKNSTGHYRSDICSENVPFIVGASEDEIASIQTFTVNSMKKLRKKLRKERNMLRMPHLDNESIDRLVIAVRNLDAKEKTAGHIYTQILSMNTFLGSGSFEMAAALAGRRSASLWLYSTAYDSPFPPSKKTPCSWHTADLPLMFRAVYHKQTESLSKCFAHAFAQFARTGSPETSDFKWMSFDNASKMTMMFDNVCNCVSDPYKTLHEAVNGIRAQA